jgi:hypothetical protein
MRVDACNHYMHVVTQYDAGDGCCGAYWHCETPEGKAFPFSRGLSFYKCNGEYCEAVSATP